MKENKMSLEKDVSNLLKDMDELTKKVRILKCKEKDLTHNMSIAYSKELELPCSGGNIFSKGRYFYMMFYETSRVYTFRFKGKWI